MNYEELAQQMHRLPRVIPVWARVPLTTLRDGAQWLRLLAEAPLPAFGEHGYCPRCRRLAGDADDLGCNHRRVRLDENFWGRVSRRIRRAYQEDPTLFSRVKADFPDGFRLMPLPEPLAWLNEAWQSAGKSPGRPPKRSTHYWIDFWVNTLRWIRLSQNEALDVLTGSIREGMRTYGGHPRRVLTRIERAYAQSLKRLGIARPDRRGIVRALSWVRHQRLDPRARIGVPDETIPARVEAQGTGSDGQKRADAIRARISQIETKLRELDEADTRARSQLEIAQVYEIHMRRGPVVQELEEEQRALKQVLAAIEGGD